MEGSAPAETWVDPEWCGEAGVPRPPAGSVRTGGRKDWLQRRRGCRLDIEGSRAEQVETEGSKGLAREETSKEKQWRGKRVRSERSTESPNKHERQYQSKRRPPVRRNW
ncbi:hypothetical protein NPIL_427111 [Nephila pilipes]|uniref:Uncharacterized protein n=1 Tax=Nephila pilipes TaxID=299642 RepID=A0A8X6QIY5_NEPPI|nr:hypothetical protein NPIL_427111 [Nephila pilipes]